MSEALELKIEPKVVSEKIEKEILAEEKVTEEKVEKFKHLHERTPYSKKQL